MEKRRQGTIPSVILVTGAAGFIGSHVAEALLQQGVKVVGIDNFDPFYSRNRKESNLEKACQSSLFQLVEGDICDSQCLETLWKKEGPFDVIVHLAARAGVRPSIADPLGYEHVNVVGTMRLLEMARHQESAPNFIFASSSSVYGNNKKVPFHEDDPVDHPISPYAATKKACELIGHTYHHLYGIPMSCLRLFTVFGPRQRPDLAIHKFVDKIMNGLPIEMYGDGSSSRDYTYIGDIVAGICTAIKNCDGFEVLNLGGTNPVTLREMIQSIEHACERSATVIEKPMQPGDVNRTYADISRASELLNYSPQTSFQQGLTKFVAWYREVHTLS